MKKLTLVRIVLICFLFVSCDKDDISYEIEDLTIQNYPKVDGSTSTDPLNRMIACKLLGYKYEWKSAVLMNGLWYLSTDLPEKFVEKQIKFSQTHNSIINLIDKKADLILSARKISADEKEYADKAKVELIETSIALDAFIFIANPNNPVKSLTTQQVQDIYTGKIKNWKEVGGNDKAIKPYVRNQNSGSQELMETLVMPGLKIADFDVDYEPELPSMSLVFTTLRGNGDALGYTVYYYKEQIVREEGAVKTFAINGIHPDKNTIRKKTYPYVAEVYLTIRSDLDKNSMAYKLYEFLQTDVAKNIISESGYIPN